MRRLACFLMVAVLIAGCGDGENGGGAETAQTSDSSPAQTPATPPEQSQAAERIPEKVERGPVEGHSLKPFFDEAGTVTELAVAPGQIFDIYVVAEAIVEPTKAAQFRVVIPEGITVLGESELSTRTVTLGSYTSNFMIAYSCHDTGRFYLTKYSCVVDAGFGGGEIEVSDGVSQSGRAFLGYSTCGNVETRASGGKATLTTK